MCDLGKARELGINPAVLYFEGKKKEQYLVKKFCHNDWPIWHYEQAAKLRHKPTEEEIAEASYYLWSKNKGLNDLDRWFAAKEELSATKYVTEKEILKLVEMVLKG